MTAENQRLIPLLKVIVAIEILRNIGYLWIGGSPAVEAGALIGLGGLGTAALIYFLRDLWSAHRKAKLGLPGLLLVEDDADTAYALRRLLEPTHAVTVVGTVASALDALDIRPEPAVVLLDLMLPDGSGERVLDMIRSHGLRSRVIVLSGAFGARVDAIRARADGRVDKPFDPKELIEAIKGEG